jgi:colicin import membrane protein
MNQEINPVEFGIEPVKAKEMLSGLSIAYAERDVLKKSYIDVIELPITEENLSSFKELRLKLVKNRTQGFESWHKTNKAFYLAGGRFVDAIKNKEVLENEQMESKLLEAEKFFENQEKERLSLLKTEREAFLRPFVETIPNGLEDLDQDVFDSFLETKKKAHLEKLEAERLEEEKKETERLAEIERQKEIEAENEKLKKESEEKELALKKERAEEKAKADKLQAENDAKLKAEKDKSDKISLELKLKNEAEQKSENERIAKEKDDKLEADKLAKAPIKKQLSVWVESFEIPVVGVDNATSKEIKEKFEAFKKWSLTQVNNL